MPAVWSVHPDIGMSASVFINCRVIDDAVIESLTKFKLVDKYASFYEALPDVRYADAGQRAIITGILNRCCSELIRLTEAQARPSALKKALSQCMDELFHAPVDALNREFGYQLGWFLAEKTGVNLSRVSERRSWGYWKVEHNEVKSVAGSRKKKIN